MTLRTAEARNSNIFGKLRNRLVEMYYAPFTTPSRGRLFSMFDIVERKKASLKWTTVNKDMIEIEQFDTNQPSGVSNIAKITVRQPIPDEMEKYIEIILERGKGKDDVLDKNSLVVKTTVVEQVATGNEDPIFKQLGQLTRHDSITKEGRYEPFEGFDYPVDNEEYSHEWLAKEAPFAMAITRAYLLLVRDLFGVGEVKKLGDWKNFKGLLDNT